MKATIVYALISTPEDFYLEENLISLYTLRIYDRESRVVVLTDEPTSHYIKSHCVDIMEYVDELRIIEVPEEFNNTERSRYLKTNLAKFIEGNFLYIDGDTVIADNLDEIENFEGDVCQVADGNGNLYLRENSRAESLFKMLNWGSCVGRPFFNSGLMFVRNNERTRKVFELWFAYWFESRQIKNFQDQPPYVKACMDCGLKITQLPDVWNCQIRAHGFYCIGEAKVIHPFAGLKDSLFLIYKKSVMEEIRKNGFVSLELIEMMKHPRMAFERDVFVLGRQEKTFYNSFVHAVFLNQPKLFKKLNSFLSFLYKLTHQKKIFSPAKLDENRWK